MLYILTSPHRNMLGLYFLPEPYACFDLGWDSERFRERLGELLRKGCLGYDETVHVVFIKNFLKHNPLENPNQVKAAMDKLDEIPTTPLMKELYEALSDAKPYYKPLRKRLLERLGEPLEEGLGKGLGERLPKQEEVEVEVEVEEAVAVAVEEGTTSASAKAQDEDFAIIVNTFSNNIHPITPIESEKLKSWLAEGMESEVIVEAIGEAVRYNNRTLRYIEAILNSWFGLGIKNKAALDAYRRDRANIRNKAGPQKYIPLNRRNKGGMVKGGGEQGEESSRNNSCGGSEFRETIGVRL